MMPRSADGGMKNRQGCVKLFRAKQLPALRNVRPGTIRGFLK